MHQNSPNQLSGKGGNSGEIVKDPRPIFLVGGSTRTNVHPRRDLGRNAINFTGQKSAEDEERLHADFARKVKERELDAWKHFKVFAPVETGFQCKDAVGVRWALSWEEAECSKTVKARLVTKGYQGPDLRNGAVAVAGCVGKRSPHSQLGVKKYKKVRSKRRRD